MICLHTSHEMFSYYRETTIKSGHRIQKLFKNYLDNFINANSFEHKTKVVNKLQQKLKLTSRKTKTTQQQ